jgi:hypothetical protein
LIAADIAVASFDGNALPAMAGERDAHQSHRIAVLIWLGSGHAGDGNGNVGGRMGESPLGHGFSHFGADRSFALQQIRESLEKRPYATLAIAFALGFVIARLR